MVLSFIYHRVRLFLTLYLETSCFYQILLLRSYMAEKSNKKKVVKTDPNKDEKVYLLNIINNLEPYAKDNQSNFLGPYFDRLIEKNKKRLEDLS